MGHDVWIGGEAIIKRGVNLGDGCVVAAGAVVTKHVPPYAIVAGGPAKIIRCRFEPEIIERIIASEWWRLSPSGLNGIDFQDVPTALAQIEERRRSGAATLVPAKHFSFTMLGRLEEVDRALF